MQLFFREYATASPLEKLTGLTGKWLRVEHFKTDLWQGTLERHCTDFVLGSRIHTEFMILKK